jgi:hypothetical protein
MEERFEDVEYLGPEDEELFAELREVLLRHGAQDRFGVTLLHRHFDTKPDEALVETVDEEARTLTVRPTRLQPGDAPTATSWRFTTDHTRPLQRLVCWPAKDTDGNIVGHMK